MKFKKICKSKKIIAVVLGLMISFSSIAFGHAESKISNHKETRIEFTNNNKVIGIKNRQKLYVGRKLTVRSTAYTSAEGGGLSFTGEKLHWGVIAVDPNVIPLGSTVYIPQFDMTFKAIDTGSAIKGNRIDIYFGNLSKALDWGIRNIDIIVIEE